MGTVALKLVLTPLLIGVATLVGRRWGAVVSGWLIALPYTAGPVVFFLTLDHGLVSGRIASVGALAGTISEALFALTYACLARRARWPGAVGAGSIIFAASATGVRHLSLSLIALFVTVIGVLILALVLMPARDAGEPSETSPSPAWDIPLRMVVATATVLLLTAIAPAVGSRTSGLLATFPALATILTVFAHYSKGPAAAVRVLRGLLVGLFAFTGFFVVLAVLLERLGIALAFGTAGAVALGVQGTSLWLLHRNDEGSTSL